MMHDVAQPEGTLRIRRVGNAALFGVFLTMVGIDVLIYHARFPDRLAQNVVMATLQLLAALL